MPYSRWLMKPSRMPSLTLSPMSRLLRKSGVGRGLAGKTVAVKMHIGGGLGYTTIHPLFVRILVDYVKEQGGRPFITDVSGYDVRRGYTPEVIGCRFIPATGKNDRSFVLRKMPAGSAVDTIQMAALLEKADFLINLSHCKGHGHSGYGGALKNLGMGFVTGVSRAAIHNTMESRPYWEKDLCRFCGLCVKNCRNDVISFTKDGRLAIDFHGCWYCMRCVAVCPAKALKLSTKNYQIFQRTLAYSAATVLREVKERAYHVNVIMNVTPFCDCWGFSTPAIIPDVGMVGGRDIVAVEEASLDLIDRQTYIPGTLPGHLALRRKTGHLFERIWGKDPYVQVKEAAALKMGSRRYRLKEIV